MNNKLTIAAIFALILIGTLAWNLFNSETNTPSAGDGTVTEAVMYKNPGCDCCDMWADYMEENGYHVTAHESNDINSVKEEHHISPEMASCHTVLIDGYVIEGHVPVEDINRLREERPDAVGLAAPGMPPSSPGMNTIDNVPYDVYLVGHNGENTVYNSY